MKWPLVQIREIAKVHYGKALKSQNRIESGSIPVYGSSGQVGNHNERLVEYPTLIIGRKGSVGEIIYADEGGWPIDTVFYTQFVGSYETDLRFFFYALKQCDLKRWIITTSIPGLNRDDLYAAKIPLPPLDEQRRIAAILDKADAVRRKRKEAIALTEDLLRSAFLEMFGDPAINPKEWNTATLGEVLIDIESGWSPKCDPREAKEEEWGVLKLGAVTYGNYNEAEHKTLFPEGVSRPGIEVKQGDLLFSRKNTYELVGASAYVYQTRPRLMLPDLIFRLCCKTDVDSVYLWQTLSQKTVRSQLTRLASGSSGSMPNISKSRLRTLTVPIPPLFLQQKYRSVAQRLWINQQRQEKNCELTDDFFNSLLQRAFQGDL